MPHSSPRKAQVEPVAALTAVLAVTAVLGVATGVVTETLPITTESPPTDTTLTRVVHTLSAGTVIEPSRLTTHRLDAATPPGYRYHVTVHAGDREWSTGPIPPQHGATTAQPVPVRVDGRVVPGRIRVVIWP